MNEDVRRALQTGANIDITTTGRKSGEPRRIEIRFHNLGGTVYLTGSPGPRDWYANVLAHPEFTFHLKRGVRADLPARAQPITDPAERRRIFDGLLPTLGHPELQQDRLERSPLVEVTFEE